MKMIDVDGAGVAPEAVDAVTKVTSAGVLHEWTIILRGGTNMSIKCSSKDHAEKTRAEFIAKWNAEMARGARVALD